MKRWRTDGAAGRCVVVAALALLFLGGAERKAGPAHQFVARLCVVGRVGEARRDADLHHLILDPERPPQCAGERRDRSFGGSPIRRDRHHGEFIAVEAAAESARGHHVPEASGERNQKLVAGLVAVRVVDVL